jgi:hypothetical protein
MSKKTLIIITEYYSLENVNENITTLNNFNDLKGHGTEEVIKLDEEEIIFVWDRDENNRSERDDWWNHFLQRKNDEVWYVIHHSKGIKPKEIPDSLKCKNGVHTPNDLVYSKAINIILDNNNNKKERIIKAVFTDSDNINAALEFLHACLDGKDKADVAKLKHFSNFEQINALYDKLNNEPASAIYVEILKQLRDEVLKKI